MSVRLKRRVATLVIGLLAFAQMSVAVAGCSMDRGAFGHAMAMGMDADPCEGCGTPLLAAADEISNLCIAHCTSDLQLDGISIALVRTAGDPPVLIVARPEPWVAARSGLDGPPSAAPPHRILLHSFQI